MPILPIFLTSLPFLGILIHHSSLLWPGCLCCSCVFCFDISRLVACHCCQQLLVVFAVHFPVVAFSISLILTRLFRLILVGFLLLLFSFVQCLCSFLFVLFCVDLYRCLLGFLQMFCHSSSQCIRESLISLVSSLLMSYVFLFFRLCLLWAFLSTLCLSCSLSEVVCCVFPGHR